MSLDFLDVSGAQLAAVSLLLFLLTPLLILAVVYCLPVDHFQRLHARVDQRPRNIGRWLWWIFRNLLGLLLCLLGIAMLALPGQGLLTLALGVMLLDFPGKRRWEDRLLQMPAVWNGLNRMRRSLGRAEFQSWGDERAARRGASKDKAKTR